MCVPYLSLISLFVLQVLLVLVVVVAMIALVEVVYPMPNPRPVAAPDPFFFYKSYLYPPFPYRFRHIVFG